MEIENNSLLERFIENAKAVNANVHLFNNTEESINYIFSKTQKTNINFLLAPGFNQSSYEILDSMLKYSELKIIKNKLRKERDKQFLSLTRADYGIAETGSLVINSESEDIRIATTLADEHFVMLDKAKIVNNSMAISGYLDTQFSRPGNFTAFISGPSRTADIERVLTLGAHGPKALHILIF